MVQMGAEHNVLTLFHRVAAFNDPHDIFSVTGFAFYGHMQIDFGIGRQGKRVLFGVAAGCVKNLRSGLFLALENTCRQCQSGRDGRDYRTRRLRLEFRRSISRAIRSAAAAAAPPPKPPALGFAICVNCWKLAIVTTAMAPFLAAAASGVRKSTQGSPNGFGGAGALPAPAAPGAAGAPSVGGAAAAPPRPPLPAASCSCWAAISAGRPATTTILPFTSSPAKGSVLVL